MGCCSTLPGTADLPRSDSLSNAVFIATPLGGQVQVHFHNECKAYTLLLSVRASVSLAEDVVSAITAIADELDCNSLLFLGSRVPGFADYDSSFWFLSTCPKVSIRRTILYTCTSELEPAVTVCARYPEVAALVINLVDCSEAELTSNVGKLEDAECPLLLLYNLRDFPQVLLQEMFEGPFAGSRQICRVEGAEETLKAVSAFIIGLEDY